MEWGNDFEDKGRWVVGDGKEIKFWEDKWVDNESPKKKFPRLWKLGWRRALFVWESSQVDQLSQL